MILSSYPAVQMKYLSSLKFTKFIRSIILPLSDVKKVYLYSPEGNFLRSLVDILLMKSVRSAPDAFINPDLLMK